MKRPIIPDFARKELRDNPESEYSKRLSKQIEEWKVMRDGSKAMDDIIMDIEKPIMIVVEWIDKQIKRFTK